MCLEEYPICHHLKELLITTQIVTHLIMVGASFIRSEHYFFLCPPVGFGGHRYGVTFSHHIVQLVHSSETQGTTLVIVAGFKMQIFWGLLSVRQKVVNIRTAANVSSDLVTTCFSFISPAAVTHCLCQDRNCAVTPPLSIHL